MRTHRISSPREMIRAAKTTRRPESENIAAAPRMMAMYIFSFPWGGIDLIGRVCTAYVLNFSEIRG